MRHRAFLKLLGGAMLFAAAVYTLLAAPGLPTDDASTLPTIAQQEVRR